MADMDLSFSSNTERPGPALTIVATQERGLGSALPKARPLPGRAFLSGSKNGVARDRGNAGRMAGLELEYLVPPPDLQPFIGLFYLFTCATDIDEVERAQRAQLRFRVAGGHTDYLFPDGTTQAAAPIHLIGPTTGPTRVTVEGPVLAFGMGLEAAGWATLMGGDASSFVNRCVDATTLFGEGPAEALVGLRNAKTLARMVAAVEPWLRARLAAQQDATLAFVRAVDAWLAGCASPALADLTDATGLSRRQVERRCNALYGAPPKLLARKTRALRAAVTIAKGGEPELDGFYDQSHMIREVKHFTGRTPRQMREEPGGLAQLTIHHRRALEGQVAPLISRT
jgi:AraC-like DNA-binding protein